MATKRKYELKQRAIRQRETRRRITEATVELHETVGPARTQISEIARRAGVQRLTVYKHFPSERELFQACSAHWRAEHPRPDPGPWSEIDDPRLRAHTALSAVYDYFGENQRMLENVLRDAETMPAVREAVATGVVPYLVDVREVIVAGWPFRGRQRERLITLVDLALQFETWRFLARSRGLRNEDAVTLMLTVITSRAASDPKASAE